MLVVGILPPFAFAEILHLLFSLLSYEFIEENVDEFIVLNLIR